MPIFYPDRLETQNPEVALVDITSLRGNSYPIEILTDVENIPENKRKIGAIVYEQKSSEFYGFKGDSVSDWSDLELWEVLGGGGSSGDGDLQTTLDSGSEASVNKDIKIGQGGDEYSRQIHLNYELEQIHIRSTGSSGGNGAIAITSINATSESSSSISLNSGTIEIKGNKLGNPIEGDILVAANTKGSTKWTSSAAFEQDLQSVFDDGSIVEVDQEVNINSGESSFSLYGSPFTIFGMEAVSIDSEGEFQVNAPSTSIVSEEFISTQTNTYTVTTTGEEPNIDVSDNAVNLTSNNELEEQQTSLLVKNGNITLAGSGLGTPGEGYTLTSIDESGKIQWTEPVGSDLQSTLNAGSSAEIEGLFNVSSGEVILNGLESLSLSTAGEMSLESGAISMNAAEGGVSISGPSADFDLEEIITFSTTECAFNTGGGSFKVQTTLDEEDLLIQENTVTVKAPLVTTNTRTISAYEHEYSLPPIPAELPNTRMFIASGSAEVIDTVNVSLPDATTTSIGRIYDFINILENATLTIDASIENQILSEGLVSSITIPNGESISFVSNTKFWIPC